MSLLRGINTFSRSTRLVRSTRSRMIHVSASAQSINRESLVKIISERCGLSQADSREAIDGVFETIVNAVAKGDKVSIGGFGIFERAHRAARKGRNPQTGAEIEIAAKEVPTFKPAKNFKEVVSGKAE